MLFLLLLVGHALALYSSKDAVIQLTPANFKQNVESTKHAVLVEFMAPWCGHCKALVPEYKKAAESLKGIARVAAIDCDAYGSFCQQYGIQGFPTIKLFQSDKKKSPIDYNQQRNAASLVDFTVSYVDGSLVKSIGKGLDEFLQANSLPKVVLFNKKSSVPPLFKALAIDFEKKLSFAEVKSTNEELVKKYEITSFPSVLIFKDGNHEKYAGQMKHSGLFTYFSEIAGTSTSKEIIQIKSQSQLKSECLDENVLCLVAFLGLEEEFEESKKQHQSNLLLLKSAVSKYTSDSFKVVWVNPIEQGRFLIQKAGVSDIFPSLLAIHAKRGFFRNFKGAFDEKSIQSFIYDLLNGRGQNVKLDFEILLNKNKDEL